MKCSPLFYIAIVLSTVRTHVPPKLLNGFRLSQRTDTTVLSTNMREFFPHVLFVFPLELKAESKDLKQFNFVYGSGKSQHAARGRPKQWKVKVTSMFRNPNFLKVKRMLRRSEWIFGDEQSTDRGLRPICNKKDWFTSVLVGIRDNQEQVKNGTQCLCRNVYAPGDTTFKITLLESPFTAHHREECLWTSIRCLDGSIQIISLSAMKDVPEMKKLQEKWANDDYIKARHIDDMKKPHLLEEAKSPSKHQTQSKVVNVNNLIGK